MTYKVSFIDMGCGQKWPTEVLLSSLLNDRELGDAEWWHRMSLMQNAVIQTSDKFLLESLNQVKEKRWGSRFPQQEVTTPQNIPTSVPTGELNCFAPTKHLKLLLQEEWFEIHRVDDRYDRQWTDDFVSALMDSEYKDYIATEWGRNNRQDFIRGCVVGLLRESGVIKGSMDSIARSAGVCDNYRTFSKYMGQCRQQPYADWVKNYVNDMSAS